jgi:hypothetical protein
MDILAQPAGEYSTKNGSVVSKLKAESLIPNWDFHNATITSTNPNGLQGLPHAPWFNRCRHYRGWTG